MSQPIAQSNIMKQSVFLERRVLTWIRSAHLLAPEDRVLITVSGGPDSVALLSLFVAWQPILNLSLWVIHVNHGLRGVEGCEDAAFVKKLSDQVGIEYFQKDLALTDSQYARRGRSLQALARENRYRAFLEAGYSLGANKIALGHTMDDQAETVVMWMLRGAGSHGLAGIPPFRDPCFIRPLLQSTRSEILTYLSEKGLNYRTDSTNTKRIYFRNRLRMDVMPVLRGLNPNVAHVLARQADILREETQYLEQLATTHLYSLVQQEGENYLVLNRTELVLLPVALQRRIWLIVLQRVGRLIYRPRFEWVELVLKRVVNGQSGAVVQVGHFSIVREYETVYVRYGGGEGTSMSANELPKHVEFPIPSHIVWPPTGQIIEGSYTSGSQQSMTVNRSCVYFDTSLFSMPLVIRSWEPGDRFFPYGFCGKRKKIQDFFTDMKVSRSRRHRVPLVVAPEGILWICGYRADHRFCMSASTVQTLRVTINPECEE